jgi:AcrR family transcriptional regulator
MSKSAARPGESSRDRFLTAADVVFVRAGYDGTTIRAIAAEAGTSLAALNRHWTGKQHLFSDVFQRHFGPIHTAQNAGFDQLDARDGAISPVADVLEAFIGPALAGAAMAGESLIGHMVYCRALTDPAPEASLIIGPLVGAVRERLLAKLRASLGTINDEDFFLAATAVLGAYTYAQVSGRRLAEALSVPYDTIAWPAAARRLAEFLAHGLMHGSVAP